MGSGSFLVTGKGARQRRVLLGVSARRELLRYLGYHPGEGKLFIGQGGEELTYYGLKEMFNRLRRETGIEHLHAHVCRHTFATLAHRNGMRGAALQELLGHTRFEVTRKYYLDVSDEDLAAEHARSAPLDHLPVGDRLSGSGGRNAASKLPEARLLHKEVGRTSIAEAARKYRVSETTIRRRLVLAGLA
jgi:hypothetical protein